MTVQLIIDNVIVPVKRISFSDGSTNFQILPPEGLVPTNHISFSVDPITPVDTIFWELLCVSCCTAEVLWEHNFTGTVTISLPYLPNARADRQFEKGQVIPLQLFIELLCEFFPIENTRLSLVDPHSDAYKAWNRFYETEVKYQHQCFVEVVKGIQSGDYIISPDKGAKEKIYKLQNHLDKLIKSVFVVEAEKKRDPTNGRILETNLPEGIDLTGKVCYIVDDICDGGGTFIPLAEKLKEAGAKEVHLYVTHGIFAKGLALFKGKIDQIHVYQTVSNYVTMTDIMNYNNGKEVR